MAKGKKGNLSWEMIAAVGVLLAGGAYQHYSSSDDSGPSAGAATEQTAPAPQTTSQANDDATTIAPWGKSENAIPWQPSAVANNQILQHRAYTVSYNDTHEEADWVYYHLTADMVEGPSDHNTEYQTDKDVALETATTNDYTRSGYTRGHLCPSADVRNDKAAHDELYMMTNMAPQTKEFNAGIWGEIESQVRYRVKKYGDLYIATGPILKPDLPKLKGEKRNRRANFNGVSIPEQFYKIVYCPAQGGKMAAYLLNAHHDKDGKEWVKYNGYKESPYHLRDYAVSVDQIERLTGIDFFSGIDNEDHLEAKTATSWFE